MPDRLSRRKSTQRLVTIEVWLFIDITEDKQWTASTPQYTCVHSPCNASSLQTRSHDTARSCITVICSPQVLLQSFFMIQKHSDLLITKSAPADSACCSVNINSMTLSTGCVLKCTLLSCKFCAFNKFSANALR